MAMDNLIRPNNALTEQTTQNHKEAKMPRPETALGRNKKMEKLSAVMLKILSFILFTVVILFSKNNDTRKVLVIVCFSVLKKPGIFITALDFLSTLKRTRIGIFAPLCFSRF
ncbi:hypothetical protein MNB_SUP05-SYMBIONT-7-633 [hydrothermal vent metagenome]|uniref:Uncharacterized protein n=1 Tax=hydrothermal vent metagenome TaxID=652676 RepID=A0A1W1E5D4_9ZZZZ